jgi:hypothetical protein
LRVFSCVLGCICMVLLGTASLTMASERDSPAYQRTLDKAKSDLEGRSATGVDPGGVRQVNLGRAPMVTSAPGKSTVCSGSTTIVCTERPAASTKCGDNSQTACTTDPACGPTTRPAGTTTKCRGEYTECRSGVVVNCTSQPANHTACVNSNTYCVKVDPNCFTYRPQGGTTICPGMLTECMYNQPVRCTREGATPTECTQHSNTRCSTPNDPRCSDPELTVSAIIDPDIGARGTTVTAVLGFSGNEDDLVVGEMDATFGEGIDVVDFEVISPVEAWVTLEIAPGAPLGAHDVFFAAGDDDFPPGAHIIYPGVFTVVETIPTLNEWGMIIVLLLLITSAIVIMKRRRTALT